jgi:hypothetical protein
VALHELLGKGFAGLELGCGLGWAEDAEAAFGELVDQAECEREFRADDSECWLFDGDDVDHLVEITKIDWNAAGQLSDAAIAGCAENFRYLRRSAKRPDQSMLATTATDYQDLHPLMRSSSPLDWCSVLRLGIARDEVKQSMLT